jgi:hypothetical protein
MSDLNFAAEPSAADGEGFDWTRLALAVLEITTAPEAQTREGRRLSHLQVLAARAGLPVPRLFGRMRLGGQLIWHGAPREHVSETGGQGGKGNNSATPTTRAYHYTMSFAIGLCAGPVSHIGRIWADGKLIDRDSLNMRLHPGTDTQLPDPALQAEMGEGRTPAYRGLAYLVFQDVDITAFGNRIPQLSFEVFAPGDAPGDLVEAVALLPGASEFGYHPEPHIRVFGLGHSGSENINASSLRSDWSVSMQALEESHAACKRVALVVTWFGDDLRAGSCRLRPGVENRDKDTAPSLWQVAGIDRAKAHLVSRIDGRPAFGGTPSDASVKAAIQDLKRRGFDVLFYPFIMVDIAPDNHRPDPYGRARQPAYPWRGRISCHPAPGQTGSVDASDKAAAQCRQFVTGATNDTDARGDNALFCLRGMIRHYAELCRAAGGVEAFLVGSELVGLSRLRDAAGDYPMAAHLRELADMVRAILPDSKISYAADWSEYGSYQPTQGQTEPDIDFPLDGFWAHDNCDFIGIDAYFPLSDWREGNAHLDAADAPAITDAAYLQGNIEGGEFYDWYYASPDDRDRQKRTPITDGQGESWLFRAKDIRNWWRHAHRPRRKGVRQAATAWQAQSKPIWFTEIGCPAVDKGSNQPNIFPDKNSAEGGLPHYSNGTRDDHIQLAYLRAYRDYFAKPANNPISPIYKGSMLPPDRHYVWAWDARPFPAFPYRTDLWSDGDNWHTGHWLNGRQSTTPLAALFDRLIADSGITLQMEGLHGAVDGYVVGQQASFRATLEPLMAAFGLDARTGDAKLHIAGRQHRPVTHLAAGDLVVRQGRAERRINRADRTIMPNRLDVHFIDADGDYSPQTVSARGNGADRPVANMVLPLALGAGMAQNLADRLFQELRLERDTVQLVLPPKYIFLQAGDIISFDDRLWRITRLVFVSAIEVEAVAFEPHLYGASTVSLPPFSTATALAPRIHARPELQLLDLPSGWRQGSGADDQAIPYLAACATPWPETVLVGLSGAGRYQPLQTPVPMGKTRTPLAAAPAGRWDNGDGFEIDMGCGDLHSHAPLAVLAGQNRLAVQTPLGWEIIQFACAELIAPNRYRLRQLLRGCLGSDAVMADRLKAGAACVLLDDRLQPLALAGEAVPEIISLHYGPAGLPHTGYGWREKRFSFTRAALQCLSPVHVKQHIQQDGGLHIGWTRRSRKGGDDFEAVDIPLGETREAYRLRLLADNAELAVIETTVPHWLYSKAMQARHRQAHPDAQNWHLAIAQISATQGAGAEAIARLDLPLD